MNGGDNYGVEGNGGGGNNMQVDDRNNYTQQER